MAIQGLGAKDRDLARQLHEAGAHLVVADIRDEAVQPIVEAYGAHPVDPSLIQAQDVDVFAPCALGAVINDVTLPQIRAKAVCGLANNQLSEPRHGEALRARRITYVPDYVVNAGGMMGAAPMIYSTPTREDSTRRILGLYDTVLAILARADAENRSSSDVADEMARTRIAAGHRFPISRRGRRTPR